MERPGYGYGTGAQPSPWEQSGWSRPAGDQPPPTPGGGFEIPSPYNTNTFNRDTYDTGNYTRPDIPPTDYPAPPAGPGAPAPYSGYGDVLGDYSVPPPPDQGEGYGYGYEAPSGEWPSYRDSGQPRYDSGGYPYGDRRFG